MGRVRLRGREKGRPPELTCKAEVACEAGNAGGAPISPVTPVTCGPP